MGFRTRIEAAVSDAINLGQTAPSPAKLASALHYAVSPGGARIRPTILMSVATACGDDRPELTNAAAAALECIHCASLVQVLLGGKRPAGFNKGFYYEPTVFDDVKDDFTIMKQEPFGPLAPMLSFKSFDEVIERANDNDLGLCSYICTNSMDKAHRASELMEAGIACLDFGRASATQVATALSSSEAELYTLERGISFVLHLMVKFILANVVDKHPVNDYGQTPLGEATKNGFKEIQRLF